MITLRTLIRLNLVVLSFFVIFVWPTNAMTNEIKNQEYFLLMMGIFHNHIGALDMLTATDSKHSDNTIRHANAIKNILGFIDHSSPENRDKKAEYERLFQISQLATSEVIQSATNWLQDHNRVPLVTALNKLKESCIGCHAE